MYAHIEDWDFLDAVYWADYTLLTIGIGNFAPATNLGRGLLLPYAITGILVLGLIVTSIRSLVLEGGKTRLTARTTEKARQRVLNNIKKENSYFTGPISNGPSLNHSDFHDSQTITMTELERRQKEFEIMRKIQKQAAFRKRWVSLAVSATVWFTLLFVGAAIFKVCPIKCLANGSSLIEFHSELSDPNNGHTWMRFISHTRHSSPSATAISSRSPVPASSSSSSGLCSPSHP